MDGAELASCQARGGCGDEARIPPVPPLTAVDVAAAATLGGFHSLAEPVAAAFLGSHRSATRADYRTTLQAWGRWCARVKVDVLGAEESHVESWIRQLEADGVAPATISRHLVALHGFYQAAVEMRVSPDDPTARVRRPRRRRDSPRRGLSHEEAAQLLAVTRERWDDALVCLLLLHGLRISEALALNVGDIVEVCGHHVARVVRHGGTRQDVTLAPRTAEAIERLSGFRPAWGFRPTPRGPTTPLFVSRRSGQRLTRRDAADWLRHAAQRAGLDIPVTPHMLRHTFIILALDAGVSLRDVQDAAGHADLSTTRRYNRTPQNAAAG